MQRGRIHDRKLIIIIRVDRGARANDGIVFVAVNRGSLATWRTTDTGGVGAPRIQNRSEAIVTEEEPLRITHRRGNLSPGRFEEASTAGRSQDDRLSARIRSGGDTTCVHSRPRNSSVGHLRIGRSVVALTRRTSASLPARGKKRGPVIISTARRRPDISNGDEGVEREREREG